MNRAVWHGKETGLVRWIESSIELPAERPEDWTEEILSLGGRRLRLARLREPDRLLDDPAVLAASRRDDYMPYWAYLWPGALLLADRILSKPWPPGMRALEIGCGLGLAGVAALAAGLDVTFSDYSPAALAVSGHNARRNGFESFATVRLDWRSPFQESFDLVLGADVLYEARCLNDVLDVLDAMLSPTGQAILSDPGRSVADPFVDRARQRGYEIEVHVRERAGQLPAGRLFQLQRPDAAAHRAAT